MGTFVTSQNTKNAFALTVTSVYALMHLLSLSLSGSDIFYLFVYCLSCLNINRFFYFYF